jgi:hypothetical protein
LIQGHRRRPWILTLILRLGGGNRRSRHDNMP